MRESTSSGREPIQLNKYVQPFKVINPNMEVVLLWLFCQYKPLAALLRFVPA